MREYRIQWFVCSLVALLLLYALEASSKTIKMSMVEVRPYQATHNFNIEEEENINNFQVLSCHRHFYKDKKSKFLHFKDNKRVEFKYQPVSIERDSFCPLYFGIFGKSGLISFGFVDFENPKYQLKMAILCNGEIISFNGVGVCQTKRELSQVIKLDSTAKITGNCVDVPYESKEFIVKATEDRCTYFLKSADKIGRISILAYDEVN